MSQELAIPDLGDLVKEAESELAEDREEIRATVLKAWEMRRFGNFWVRNTTAPRREDGADAVDVTLEIPDFTYACGCGPEPHLFSTTIWRSPKEYVWARDIHNTQTMLLLTAIEVKQGLCWRHQDIARGRLKGTVEDYELLDLYEELDHEDEKPPMTSRQWASRFFPK